MASTYISQKTAKLRLEIIERVTLETAFELTPEIPDFSGWFATKVKGWSAKEVHQYNEMIYDGIELIKRLDKQRILTCPKN